MAEVLDIKSLSQVVSRKESAGVCMRQTSTAAASRQTTPPAPSRVEFKELDQIYVVSRLRTMGLNVMVTNPTYCNVVILCVVANLSSLPASRLLTLEYDYLSRR